MSARPDHVEFEETVGAYVLDALSDPERTAFEEHLAGCPRCRQDVAELRIAADALPVSSPPMAPPPELKERIMSIVRAEADLLQAAGERADAPEPAAPARRWLPKMPRSLRMRPMIAVAAAACALLIGGVAGFALNGDGTDTQTFAAQVDRSAAPAATAELRVRDGSATLRVSGMKNPTGGRVYQVWLLQRGQMGPTPTNALFAVRSDGTASVSVPGDLHGVQKVLVTPEPPGGSAVPSTDPVIAVATA